jgi:tyrosinase
MANPISSPGDPIFYLHHTWLDKVWWDWQALNLSSRLYDIGGYNRQLDNFTFNDVEGGANSTYKAPSYTGDPGNVTTLNHVLSSLGLWPNTRVHDVMDIRGPYLCYEYVEAEDIFYPEIGSSNLAEERANVKNL